MDVAPLLFTKTSIWFKYDFKTVYWTEELHNEGKQLSIEMVACSINRKLQSVSKATGYYN